MQTANAIMAKWYYMVFSVGVGGICLMVGKEWDNYVSLFLMPPVCKHHQWGYWRNGCQCNHFCNNIICKERVCLNTNCKEKHPKTCTYYARNSKGKMIWLVQHWL